MSHILPSLPVQQDQISASELHPRPPHLAPDIAEQLRATLESIRHSRDIEQVAVKVKQYCVMLVSGREQQLFTEHFLQTKFLQLLHRRLVQFRYGGVLLRSVFAVFEFLMKGLKMQENLMFFLLQLNQVGFVSERYVFREEEDVAYYGNFLKLLVRKVNDDEKYLTVFFNMNKPHFPLLLNLLRFHDAPDMVLHTTVKLVLLELAKNPNPALKHYTHNFPFVLFYPLYVAQIAISFRKAIAEEPGWDEHLSENLKYMEEFIADKDRAAVDIYTNTFLQAIGKEIHQQLMNTNENTLRRAVIMLRLVVEVVIPELSVLKIKMGLLLLLLPQTTASIRRAVESRLPQLDTRYWLVEECEEWVISHCTKVFYGREIGGRSLLRTVNSFIPGSRAYWLYYQMRKLGQLIGFTVTLGEPLDLENYQPGSFLHALESLPDESLNSNELFLQIIRLKDEELLYYYIRLLTPLFSSHPISFNFLPLLHQLHICNSLALLHVFYSMILNFRIQIQIADSTALNPLFEQLTQRLVHFIMTRGWKEFLVRVEGSRLKQNNERFFLDAYREVECDILLFAGLRCLLGTWNDEATLFVLKDWDQQGCITCETTFRCHNASEDLTLTLDGQYVKIRNRMEMLIHTEQLLLSQLQLYEQGESVQLMGSNGCNWGMKLQIDHKMTDYLLREASERRKLSSRVVRELRTMRLPFVL